MKKLISWVKNLFKKKSTPKGAVLNIETLIELIGQDHVNIYNGYSKYFDRINNFEVFYGKRFIVEVGNIGLELIGDSTMVNKATVTMIVDQDHHLGFFNINFIDLFYSVNVERHFVVKCEKFIEKKYSKLYIPESSNIYKFLCPSIKNSKGKGFIGVQGEYKLL